MYAMALAISSYFMNQYGARKEKRRFPACEHSELPPGLFVFYHPLKRLKIIEYAVEKWRPELSCENTIVYAMHEPSLFRYALEAF